ncbi:hypothetical protein ACFWPX_03275 [Nocardia sp. NPDC058518]|uniref:hypothetical protein n=1 Tax=Nocardia sp. NPDC058518 TaxID=3346534 RepID=UPI0036485FCA
MSHPLDGADRLPPWQLRLLERIQSISELHHRTVFHGRPQYSAGNGAGSVQLETWHTHLRALEGERSELELHAYGVHVPQRMIRYAAETGGRGVRWGESAETARLSPAPPGVDPVSQAMLEQIAGDVWRLELSALVRAEHLHRVHTGALPDDERGERQLHDNMAALWRRATGTAALIEIDPVAGEQIWGRSPESWHNLAELTAASYTDLELRERFGSLAWTGIEAEVSRNFDNLASTATTIGPPTPNEMADRAEAALAAVSFADGQGARFDHSIGGAVEATGTEVGTEWEPDLDPQPHPPNRGPGVGANQGVES